jgi:hypothetical protein
MPDEQAHAGPSSSLGYQSCLASARVPNDHDDTGHAPPRPIDSLTDGFDLDRSTDELAPRRHAHRSQSDGTGDRHNPRSGVPALPRKTESTLLIADPSARDHPPRSTGTRLDGWPRILVGHRDPPPGNGAKPFREVASILILAMNTRAEVVLAVVRNQVSGLIDKPAVAARTAGPSDGVGENSAVTVRTHRPVDRHVFRGLGSSEPSHV